MNIQHWHHQSLRELNWQSQMSADDLLTTSLRALRYQGAEDVLRNVGINLFPIFINLGRCEPGFARFLQFELLPMVLPEAVAIIEERNRRSEYRKGERREFCKNWTISWRQFWLRITTTDEAEPDF